MMMLGKTKSPLVRSSVASLVLALVASTPAASPLFAQQGSAPVFGERREVDAAQATYVAPPGPLQQPPLAQEPRLLTLPNTTMPATTTAPVAEPVAAVGLTPAEAKTYKKLALPGADRSSTDKSGAAKAGTDPSAARTTPAAGLSGVVSVLASLGVVLGLFIAMAWLMRRGLPKQGRVVPREAVQSLGRIPFPGRQQGQLLRVGNKIVLVSFSNSGADVLAEITDPLEVDRLSGLCAQADQYSSVKTFRDVVDQFFGEKPARREAARAAVAARFKERDVV